MESIDRVRSLAQEATTLLPEAPAEGDVLGYLAWRELVWETALTLGRLAGAGECRYEPTDRIPSKRVTTGDLLALASLANGMQRAPAARAGLTPR